MWFDTWEQLGRVVVAAGVGYAALVVLLRGSGKRTLSTLNAFDLVVTVALGSTLATIALSSDVALVEGAAVLGTLVGLQFVVAWSAARTGAVREAVKSEPVAVLTDGELDLSELRRQRLAPDEVRQAVRSAGVGGLELVAVVVLETNGELSVVGRDQVGSGSALIDVTRAVRGPAPVPDT